MRLFGLSVLSALELLAAVGSASGHGLGLQPGCGDTITVDTTLTRNLVDCPNNGLVIGAAGITLDLKRARHRR